MSRTAAPPAIAPGPVLEVVAPGEDRVGTRALCSRCAHPPEEHFPRGRRGRTDCAHEVAPGGRRCACTRLVLPKAAEKRNPRT